MRDHSICLVVVQDILAEGEEHKFTCIDGCSTKMSVTVIPSYQNCECGRRYYFRYPNATIHSRVVSPDSPRKTTAENDNGGK